MANESFSQVLANRKFSKGSQLKNENEKINKIFSIRARDASKVYLRGHKLQISNRGRTRPLSCGS